MDIREEIRARLDIVEVIGQFVALKLQGRNYVGLCPFHQEKNPSFSVNREAQFFHCFGCKAGGDVINFWMRFHELSFQDAVEDICARYGISLPEKVGIGYPEIKAILNVNEVAKEFFQRVLWSPKAGQAAHRYLTKRGLKKEIIETFGIGYAPDSWDTLSSYLRKKGLLTEGIKAGLIASKGENIFDRFRNRVMFPLFGLRGEIVGFGGRSLSETDREPKYLNTPETSAFQKRRYLYGFYQGVPNIRASNTVIFVEGYMDLLALHSYGLKNCVATLGTSLTKEHLRLIQAYAKEVVLIFDGDSAGKAAMFRVLPVLLNAEINPKVVVLPEGHDPDTFLRERGYVELRALIERSTDAIRFYTESVKVAHPEREEQIKAIRVLLRIVGGLSSPILQGEYLRKISEYMNIPYELLYAEMKNITGEDQGTYTSSTLATNKNSSYIKDLEAINLFYYNSELIERVDSDELSRLCLSESTINLIRKMKNCLEENNSLDTKYLFSVCTEEEKCILREVILSKPMLVNKDISTTLAILKNRIMTNIICDKIRKAKEEGNLEMINMLLKQKAELLTEFSQTI